MVLRRWSLCVLLLVAFVEFMLALFLKPVSDEVSFALPYAIFLFLISFLVAVAAGRDLCFILPKCLGGMKRAFYTLFILVGLSGCTSEEIDVPGEEEGEIVSIQVAAMTDQNVDISTLSNNVVASTRYSGKPDYSTMCGCKENVEWSNYDMRYICEVWTVAGAAKRILRLVETRSDISDNTLTDKPVVFNMKLMKGQEYRFMFWADVVEEGSASDYNYTTDLKDGNQIFGLHGVRMVGPQTDDDVMNYVGNSPTLDAFAARLPDDDNKNKGVTVEQLKAHLEGLPGQKLLLNRPFAKLVFQKEIPSATETTEEEVTVYYNDNINALYDVGQDNAEPWKNSAPYFKAEPFKEVTLKDGKYYQTASVDYLFVPKTATKTSISIMQGSFCRVVTQVPLERNKVTVVRGAIDREVFAPGRACWVNVATRIKIPKSETEPEERFESIEYKAPGVICWVNPTGTEALLMSVKQSELGNWEAGGDFIQNLNDPISTTTHVFKANNTTTSQNIDAITGATRAWVMPTLTDVAKMFDKDLGIAKSPVSNEAKSAFMNFSYALEAGEITNQIGGGGIGLIQNGKYWTSNSLTDRGYPDNYWQFVMPSGFTSEKKDDDPDDNKVPYSYTITDAVKNTNQEAFYGFTRGILRLNVNQDKIISNPLP